MVSKSKEKKFVYLGLIFDTEKCLVVSKINNHRLTKTILVKKGETLDISISKWITQLTKKADFKIIGAGILGDSEKLAVSSRLWLEHDIVPINLKRKYRIDKVEVLRLRLEAKHLFDKNGVLKVNTKRSQEVTVQDLVSLQEYRKITSRQRFDALVTLAKEYKELDGRLIFINATPQGGGVALMRHALIRLYRLFDCNVRWYTLLNKNTEFFNITKKKFHNILQSVAPSDLVLTEEDIQVYKNEIKRNVKCLKSAIKNANVIVIDDPQTSGLIPYIKKINPKSKIIYRSHIHLDTDLMSIKKTPQNTTWNFLWSFIKQCDIFVSHPIEEFVPHNVPKRKVVFMPAVTDSLDGLNKKLSSIQTRYYLNMFNTVLIQNKQKPIDSSRPYIVQIARFDPSKGIIDVIEAYRALRLRMEKRGVDKKLIPQLVIAGHGAVDDPEGNPILVETLNIINMYRYHLYAKDIKIARLFHSDQLLNVLLRESNIAMQLSYKEGFEVKVTEAVSKGKPVIAYNSGGIPLQIQHGRNGYIVDPGDTDRVAHYLYKLLTDHELYKRMSKTCVRELNNDFFTMANATKFLQLANHLLHNKRTYIQKALE